MHKKGIDDVKKDILKRGLEIDTETFFKNKNGKSRYADVSALNKKGNLEEIHQIGKQNKNGSPVKRERTAMNDLEKLSGIKVIFHPYNLLLIALFLIGAFIYFD